MRPLNVFVVHSCDVPTDHLPRGEGWIVYNYLKRLAERGHTIHLAAPTVALREPAPPGLHVHLIPHASRLSYWRAVRALLTKLSASVQLDIAQQFTPVQTGLSLSLLGSGIPLVLGPYSGYWPADADGVPTRQNVPSIIKRTLRDSLAAFQQSQADALIVTCPAAVERIASRKAREMRMHVVSPGIDVNAFPARECMPENPSIVFLANLHYRKGIGTLLDAFELVARALPSCTLEIWGEGTETACVKQRIVQSPYRDRIVQRGSARRDQIGQIMRSHSLYCLPSHGEPFGMTLLEAMASGVPVVSTNIGGPPFIVRREGGRIVPVRNAQRLADALIEVLSSTDLQKSMGLFNRRRAEQEFDWSHSLDKLETVYEQVLNERADQSNDGRRLRAGF
jgi:glycosyltransferase involved in cell wall biosynthesis